MPNLSAASNLGTARAFLRQVRQTHPDLSKWAYLLHLPSSDTCWVGLGAKRVVNLIGTGFEIIADGHKTSAPAGPDFFRDLRELLDPALPCFFLVSLDIKRPARDPGLPLMTFVQPLAEIHLDRQTARSPNLFATDPTLKATLAELLSRSPTESLALEVNREVSATSTWLGEDDEHFLARLESAVQTLQRIHGKMIITRTYHKSASSHTDLLSLFEIYSTFESNAAACHFATLGEVGSLGCSPENVFEMDGSQLTFDVVASTRGISPDPAQDARWLNELLTDVKERKEHNMALERYQKRMERLCQPGSVILERHMDVRTLRHVRHLFSRISGTLKDGLDCFDMLHDSFPPLSSYPDELIPLADPGKEPTRYYGGMVGRLGPGWQDACCYLNLRSLLMQGGELYTQGGVGVIRESIPRQELLEVANKLRSLKEAVAVWEKSNP